MSVKNQIIKGTIILTLASVLSRVIGFLYRIFLSNLIGARGMGIFQLIFPVLGFCVALSCGGIQIAVSRFVAESRNNKDKFLVFVSSIIMSLFLSVTTALLLFYFADSISLHIIKNNECEKLLKYAAITIPLTTFHACVSGYYLGLKKTFVPAVSSIFEQIVKVYFPIHIRTGLGGKSHRNHSSYCSIFNGNIRIRRGYFLCNCNKH